MNTSTPATPTKHRAWQLRMPVFVVIVAGFALVMWAWKFNRANRNIDRATMTLHLNELSRSTDPELRRDAASVLADTPTELAPETVEPLLIAASRDPDPGVRAVAVHSFVLLLSGNAWERTGDEMAEQVDRVLPALTALLDDRNPEVRSQVATSLGMTVANLARAREGKVDAESALVTKALAKMLADDPDETARLKAVQALLAMRLQLQVPAPPPSGKKATLAVSPDPKFVTPVLEAALLRERSVKVQDALIEAIIKFHPTSNEAPPFLLSLLRPGHPPWLRMTLLQRLSYLPMPFKLVVGGWINSDDLWPLHIAILRDGTIQEKFAARELMTQSLRPPPAAIVPKLVDLLSTPGVPFRDQIAYVLKTSLTKPDPGAMQRAAEAIGKQAIAEQTEGIQSSAMILSLLGCETPESAEVRRNLIRELRRLIAEAPVRPGPGFTDDGSLMNSHGNVTRNANEIAGILANFGPNAADIVPELVAIFRENSDPRIRDLLADLFTQIGPAAHAALPLLKERADDEIHLLDGATIQLSRTFTDTRSTPLLASASAMFAINPNALETRSLIVPIAIFAETAVNSRYNTAAFKWLTKTFSHDPSLTRQLDDAAKTTSDPRTRAALMRVFQEFSDLATDPDQPLESH